MVPSGLLSIFAWQNREVAKVRLLLFSLSRYNRYQRATSDLLTSKTISTQSMNSKIVELSDAAVCSRSFTENSWWVKIASEASATGKMKSIIMEWKIWLWRDLRLAKLLKNYSFSCFRFFNEMG